VAKSGVGDSGVLYGVKAEHLYVHVPFCARRCVYCDFSIAVRAHVPTGEYLDALATELRVRHRDSDLDLATVYFGGGTPSKLGADGVRRMMDSVRRSTNIRADAEVTLEANPEDVDAAAASAWRDAGVNRVSLGVQSFHDSVLAWMHRTHNSEQAVAAVDVLREVGIDNISADLIFASPASIERPWEDDLNRAFSLGLPHLSVYGLTVEPHTPLGRWVARKSVSESSEESFETQFLRAHSQLESAGYRHYEVSNYGVPGMESAHNWAYWQRRPYAGLGPSAHEFDGRVRRWNTSAYADWVRRLGDDSDLTEGSEMLSAADIAAEEAYLGLRTAAGLTISPKELEKVTPWIAAGWAEVTNNQLRLTALGWLRLDALVSDLTAFRSRY